MSWRARCSIIWPQLQASTDSSRAPDSFSSNWGKDIKVEIPETGISFSEGYRYLAGWLGHQTHITGEVYHTTNGVAVVTRVSGFPGVRFEGREADLDSLIARAADSVYSLTQPYRYAIYVGSVREERVRGEKLLHDLATNGSDADRPWAYSVWGEAALSQDNIVAALARARKAMALAPDIPLIVYNVAQIEANAGHDEQELEAAEHAASRARRLRRRQGDRAVGAHHRHASPRDDRGRNGRLRLRDGL